MARKIVFLAAQARKKNARWLASFAPFEHVQWDELITFEHSRLKPLSIALMSCSKTRNMIGYGIAQIPAGGAIAKRSREKYGPRPDRSGPMRRRVLKEVSGLLSPTLQIDSDQHARYAAEIRKVLPQATHKQYHSVRGSLTGFGELKRTGFDPLLRINHSLASLPDNVKRLTRQTWCTTKRTSGLDDVLAIVMHCYNVELLRQWRKDKGILV